MNQIANFLKRPAIEKYIFLEAAFWLSISRLILVILPFRWVAPFLGSHMKESKIQPIHEKDRENIISIEQGIRRVSVLLPWECKCLVKAIACKIMLRLRHIQSTLYLGVAKKENQELIAHAWLRCYDRILTGRSGMNQFTIVSTFT